jgi:hypothetical protein
MDPSNVFKRDVDGVGANVYFDERAKKVVHLIETRWNVMGIRWGQRKIYK